MKFIPILFLSLLLLSSCSNSSGGKDKNPDKGTVVQEKFFPVTAYLRGQVAELNQRGTPPLKYTTRNEHTDSSWIKKEESDSLFRQFLTPVIDSTNLTGLFTEKKFMDQSINAFTFTYDAKGPLPDSMQLQHWDVYVEPESGKVRRIYMVKNIGAGKILQLTWQGDKWCKLVSIKDQPDGSSSIEYDIKLSWDY